MALNVPGKETLAAENGPSFTPSNASLMEEKVEAQPHHDKNLEGGDAHQDGAALERVESSMYPSSFKLASILVAVSMSIFLVALDMVS